MAPAAMTGEGSRRARAYLAAIGNDIAIAYGVFVVLACFVSVIQASGIVDVSFTLADLLSGNTGFVALTGSSVRGSLLILLVTATIAVPYFWKHKLAPLAFTTPLALTLYAFWPLQEQHRTERDALVALGELGGRVGLTAEQMRSAVSPFDALEVGAYLMFATVIYLAVRGVMRAFGR
jgi:hypothetical protein